MATVALFIWRTLIVGSRILVFVLFVSLFKYWLFVIVGFHYLLMFAFVFYQLYSINKQPIARLVYNIVTPFIYIFDFCVNWLEGPTRYWYVMCYVPMYCENILMSALGLWYASTTPTPAWYIIPGCVCVIVMFPVAVLVQLAYYRYWHPNVQHAVEPNNKPMQTAGFFQPMTWSNFQRAVSDANGRRDENRENLVLAACL